VLNRLDISSEFDAVVDGSMITRTKPDPEIFLTAAAKLGVDPSECLVVEDAEAGVEAARAAGMMVIGIGSPITLQKAQRVFPKTSDITLETIQELTKVNR
jgi:beta-phosphoglucomutase